GGGWGRGQAPPREHAMDMEEVLLQAIHACPGDFVAWQALADWLEEQDDGRAEMLRLQLALRGGLSGAEAKRAEDRIVELLLAGARPCAPTLTNSLGMTMVLVPAGKFVMGASPRHKGTRLKEGPRHEVQITRPFYLGAHLVTQEQYEKVM